LEDGQVRVEVHGESVAGHSATDAYANGSDFAMAGPHAGEAGLHTGRHSTGGQPFDDEFFERSQVRMGIVSSRSQAQDGVRDQLPGTVKSGLAAAIAVDDLDPAITKRKALAIGKPSIERSPEGCDGVVFEKEDGIGDQSIDPRRERFGLNLDGTPVGNPT